MFIESKTVFARRGITATPYNDCWRKHRRLATTWLNPRAVDGYSDVLDYEATVLLIDPQLHASQCSLNNILKIVFETRTNSIDDELVKTSLRISRKFMNCTRPMSNLTDFVDPLQWFTSPFTAT